MWVSKRNQLFGQTLPSPTLKGKKKTDIYLLHYTPHLFRFHAERVERIKNIRGKKKVSIKIKI